MIRVFYGENRVAAMEEARKILGDEHEVVEGAELVSTDLPSLFLGQSLFVPQRKILIKDILANAAIAEDIARYVKTPHEIVFLEMKVERRGKAYKALKDEVEFREFAMPKNANAGMVFDIYKTAKRDGRKAVEMLERVQAENEPIMFLGLMVSQAMRDFTARPGAKEKRALQELSRLDMQMKAGSKLSPWTLIAAFLLRLASL